ncbi:efflux RND transporter permease subunit [Congregibacter variabilis]|uniref:Efflux RND transporter permease subunit n=1 Tax=Congregibacter variabilis TaxID=3081200 RepID=A0ABZ0HXR4_9GAMM|nr:efflux RND transporter permease subunit [Congregibacter sp. IMCC43200]
MLISDIAVRRPVMALVGSALIVAFGLLAFDRLPLREYPDIDSPIVTVQTSYPGASAAVVENKITELIENRLSGIEGIKTLSSASYDGESTVTIEFNLDRDIDSAANDVRDRVSGVLDNLPEEALPPETRKSNSDEQVIFWSHLVGENMSALELTDYARRYLEDRFAVLDGVARVRIGGGQIYSMRIWLDRNALVARGLTVSDVEAALRSQNVELPAGTIKSSQRDFVVRIDRSYQVAKDFQELVLARGDDGYLVRLADVARVELSSAESRSMFRGNTESMVGVGIVKQSKANALSVGRAVQAEIVRVNQQLPDGMELVVGFDRSVFVDAAIDEVFSTLFIAGVLVVIVIFLFLGDPRSVLVPALTVPISLIGSFSMLWALGYSINLLTLLALVLAIGLVVDDSIVVLENIHRRLVRGESALVASYRGSRQVAFAVIATTLVLVAVFIPITFLEGNIGRLFAEFAVAMAIAVIFSSFVALTLGPVICSKLLDKEKVSNRLADKVEALSEAMELRYRKVLTPVVKRSWMFIPVLLVCVLAAWQLSRTVPQEFSPTEDRGVLYMIASTPEGSSFEYTVDQVLQVEELLMPLVESGEVRRLLIRAPGWGGGESFNQAFTIMALAPWEERERTSQEIAADAQERVKDIAGARIFVRAPRSFGGGNADPVQFVVGGDSYENLAEWQDIMLKAVAENPGLLRVDTDLKPTKPQLRVSVDRNRAGDLGISLADIGRTLETLLGSRRVTTFIMGGREYDVILEGDREESRTLSDLDNIYVRSTTTDQLIPLSNMVTLREEAGAGSLNRYNRVRSFTLSASLADDYKLGEALDYLQELVRTELPETASFDFKGESLEYYRASGSIYVTFLLALLIVYLVMAAQFESFVHPAIILFTVPVALLGGLWGLQIVGATLNIYSQVGLIMLVGLAAKNGILIVEFINQMRDAGFDFERSVIEGSSKRLRPIVMTAFTTVMGALPLVLSTGPGHEVRSVIGVVVMGGVALATLVTLFLVPMAYSLMARGTGSPDLVSRQLDAEMESFDAAKLSATTAAANVSAKTS